MQIRYAVFVCALATTSLADAMEEPNPTKQTANLMNPVQAWQDWYLSKPEAKPVTVTRRYNKAMQSVVQSAVEIVSSHFGLDVEHDMYAHLWRESLYASIRAYRVDRMVQKGAPESFNLYGLKALILDKLLEWWKAEAIMRAVGARGVAYPVMQPMPMPVEMYMPQPMGACPPVLFDPGNAGYTEVATSMVGLQLEQNMQWPVQQNFGQPSAPPHENQQ